MSKFSLYSVSGSCTLLHFSLYFQVTPILGVLLIILCVIFVVEPVRGQIEKSQGEGEIVADEGVIIRHSWFNDVKHILRWWVIKIYVFVEYLI